MTSKQRAYQNISKWRGLSSEKRQAISRASVISHIKTSMAMEGEPVSDTWLKKNAR